MTPQDYVFDSLARLAPEDDWTEDSEPIEAGRYAERDLERLARKFYEPGKYEKKLRPILDEELVSIFHELRTQWEDETLHLSSSAEAVQNINYQQIIGLGSDVVPLLLKDLKETRNLWFWALRMIARENPVPEDHKGDIDKMTEDWIEWGRVKGLI